MAKIALTEEEKEQLLRFMDEDELTRLQKVLHPSTLRVLAFISIEPGHKRDDVASRLALHKTTVSKGLGKIRRAAISSKPVKKIMDDHEAAVERKPLAQAYPDENLLAVMFSEPGHDENELCAILGVSKKTVSVCKGRIKGLTLTDKTVKRVRDRHIAALEKKPPSGNQEENLLVLLYLEPGISWKERTERLDISEKTLQKCMKALKKLAEKDEIVKGILERHGRWTRLRPLYLVLKTDPYLTRKEAADKLKVAKGRVSATLKRLETLAETEPDVRRVFGELYKRRPLLSSPVILFSKRHQTIILNSMRSGGYGEYLERLGRQLSAAVARKVDLPYFAEKVLIHRFAAILHLNITKYKSTRRREELLDTYRLPLLLMPQILYEFEKIPKS